MLTVLQYYEGRSNKAYMKRVRSGKAQRGTSEPHFDRQATFLPEERERGRSRQRGKRGRA